MGREKRNESEMGKKEKKEKKKRKKRKVKKGDGWAGWLAGWLDTRTRPHKSNNNYGPGHQLKLASQKTRVTHFAQSSVTGLCARFKASSVFGQRASE